YQSRERDLPAAPLSPDSGSDYEESAKSIKSKNHDSLNTVTSATSKNLNDDSHNIPSSPTSTTKVKLPTLAIANDKLATSEAILTTTTTKFSSMTLLDTTDEMLLQLLISQAIVDSKGFELLSLEEVEELKKVC